MLKLAERVAKKTGLTILECESLIAVVGEELIEVLRISPSVVFNKLGVVFRSDNEDGRRLTIVLDKPVKDKLTKPVDDGDVHEIIFK